MPKCLLYVFDLTISVAKSFYRKKEKINKERSKKIDQKEENKECKMYIVRDRGTVADIEREDET